MGTSPTGHPIEAPVENFAGPIITTVTGPPPLPQPRLLGPRAMNHPKGSARFTLNAGFRAKVPSSASAPLEAKWDAFASLKKHPAAKIPVGSSTGISSGTGASSMPEQKKLGVKADKKSRVNNTIPPSVRMSNSSTNGPPKPYRRGLHESRLRER
ncbi:hypothetical protein A0H81_13511 [Grifola frondosa]|uniref:Uncharacterized protein n=1 Tax=Grifola frondosa TaxID=5627 RepID=A0A1C7LRV1_GRIFR|nr:hypothetical protein A0H81_13511 [Grifola frondosa]